MDLITIGIPIYNVEKYVERALLSALAQTYSNIEYIIVDDKGTDQSMAIVRRIIASHPRGKDVKIVEHSQNIGTDAGRNTAIDLSSGDYVFFMDSDDKLSPDCIEKLYAKMLADDVDFVTGSYRRLSADSECSTDYIHNGPTMQGRMEIASQFFEKRNPDLPVFPWNRLFKTSFLRNNQLRCIPHHLNEDTTFAFQYFCKAQSCSFIPDITYFYFDTLDSVVNQSKNKSVSGRFCEQYVEMIAFMYAFARHYKTEKIYGAILQWIVFQFIFYTSKIYNSNAITPEKKKEFLEKITAFPLTFKDILNLKSRKIFLLNVWLISRMPFRVALFRFLYTLSQLKKNVSK